MTDMVPSQENLALFKARFCRVTDAYGVMTENGPVTRRSLLTDDLILSHLRGGNRIGALFLDQEGRSDQLCFDIDQMDPGLALAVFHACKEVGIIAFIESSKSKGFHVRALFEESVEASELRRIGGCIARKASTPHIEIFPKQDRRPEGGLGNFVWLPMHGESLSEGKSAILVPENELKPYEDQWEALDGIRTNSLETLGGAIASFEEDCEPFPDKECRKTSPISEATRIPNGTRDTTLASIAGKLRRQGLTAKAIEAALQETNRMQCDPPLEEKQVTKIAKSVSRYAPAYQITPCNLPVIDAGNQDLPHTAGEAWKAILAANTPPRLFRYGDKPVRLENNISGAKIIQILNVDMVRYEVARAARWVRYKPSKEEMKEKPAFPPSEIVRDMLADPDIPLPCLNGIVKSPFFTPSGDLVVSSGYNDETGIYCDLSDTLLISPVPERPSLDHLDCARDLILEELLGDFTFTGDAEQAHAVALMILPFVREMISGPTPLHLIEKPTPGTGASLLAEVLAIPSIGGSVPNMTEGENDEEWRKRITASLLRGPAYVVIDNLRHRLDSSALSSALTSSCWSDRRLGVSEIVHIPIRCAWVATGNNPSLSNEISRRTVRIRLDAKQDRPWLRTGFRHPNLLDWAVKNRGQLAWAVLIMVQKWIADGRPRPEGLTILGSYEKYSRILGGILHSCDIPGFLQNLKNICDESDDESAEMRIFISAWFDKYEDTTVGVSQLFEIANGEDSTLSLGGGQERSQKTRLGKLLSKHRDRRYDLEGGQSVIVTRVKSTSRAAQWRLSGIQ